MKQKLLLALCFIFTISFIFNGCKNKATETNPTPEPVPTEPTKIEPSEESEPLSTASDTASELETIIGGTPVLMLNETTTTGTVKKGDLILISLPVKSEQGYEWTSEAPEGVKKTGSGISATVEEKEMIPTPDAEAMPTAEDAATPTPEGTGEASPMAEKEASATPGGEATPSPESDETAEPVGEQHHFGFKASEANEYIIKVMLKNESETKEEIEFTITVTE